MTTWKEHRFGHPGFHKQTQGSGFNLLVLIMLGSFNNHVEGSYHRCGLNVSAQCDSQDCRCATLLWSLRSVVIVSAIKASQQVLFNLNALLVTTVLFACCYCCGSCGCCSMCSCHCAYFWSIMWNIFLPWPIRTETLSGIPGSPIYKLGTGSSLVFNSSLTLVLWPSAVPHQVASC